MSLPLIFLSVLSMLGGFALLIWGADRFVEGASATASNLGVSPLIIGLTIVGFGTSAPEILVSLMAALDNNPGLAIGNALGSNITNIGLVLGVTAIIIPLTVKSDTLRREYPLMFSIMLVTLALFADGYLSRVDGFILLGGLVLLVYWLIRLGMRQSRVDPMEKEFAREIPRMLMPRAVMWVVLGLLTLMVGSRLLVWGAINIAQALHVSDLVIGLTIVAIGTSLPELAASIMSALKKEPDIAIGNVIGSNMFNLLAVMGLPGAIAPMRVDPAVLTRDFPFMIGLSIALFGLSYGFKGDGRLGRASGILLVVGYCSYLITLYLTLR